MKKFGNLYGGFITGTGRVGTKLFGDKLDSLIDNAFSVHEPDVLINHEKGDLSKRISTFGIYHMIIGRLLGKTGIRNITSQYITGKIDLETLKNKIYGHRHDYYESIEEDFIIEAYSGWFGAVDAIRELYDNYKVAGIIRDPRTWIVSCLSRQGGLRKIHRRLGYWRLNPQAINDSDYASEWKNMGKFAKLCWHWKTTYEILFDSFDNDYNCKVFKFEDLLKSHNKYDTLDELLSFLCTFKDREFSYKLKNDFFSKKVNKSTEKVIPSWQEWSPQKARLLHKICNPVMNNLGYGKEKRWVEKLAE